MSKDQKQSAASPDLSAFHRNVTELVPISKASPHQEGSRGSIGFDLIDQAVELIRTSEQRASHAQEKAEKISAKALEAVRAAQLRIEQTQSHARLVEQHAAEQAKLAEERIAKTEALAQERIEKAQAWAQEAEERARSAECQLQEAQARAIDAEDRLEHLNQALSRKLSSASMNRPAVIHNLRSLN
jgi:hypothetical protein